MKIVLSLILFLISFTSFSKKKIDTFYFDNRMVACNVNYNSFRTILKVKKKLFKVTDYSKDGSLLQTGYSIVETKPKWLFHYDKTGLYQRYYEGLNQVCYTSEYFKGSIKQGTKVKRYFKNGRLYIIDSITLLVDTMTSLEYSRAITLEVYDSLGNPLVINGNGFAEIYEPSINKVLYISRGKLVNGIRDSIWISRYVETNKAYYNEKYDQGELIGGVSFDTEGNRYKYKEVFKPFEFIGPDDNMSKFIYLRLKYPEYCMANEIRGKIYVRFIIEKNGEINSVYKLNKKHPLLDEEAIRVTKRLSGFLVPNIIRGQKERTTSTHWIDFQYYIQTIR